MDKASLIPTPDECIDFYIEESLKFIASRLLSNRESRFDICPHSGLSYNDAIDCGNHIKRICESRGWTVTCVINDIANKNRWVAMKIYKK